MERKKLLFVTQELDPYLAIGEIGNMVKKIAPFINDNGLEVRILMPRFGLINERRNRLHEVVRLSGINIIIDGDDYPLIIKVASLPTARIQVYFLDNEEFFKRKQVFRDEEDVFFDDNAERMVFFSKALLEIVKKFGWAPDIIHCNGWFTSLVPLFIKTQYAKDPVFANTKIVYSVYENEFTEKLNPNFLKIAKIGADISEKDLSIFKDLDNNCLTISAIKHADAVIFGNEIIENMSNIKKAIGKKPILEYQEEGEMNATYLEFYKMLIQ